MARFKYSDNSQGQFIAVNLKEQIALGTFERAVSHTIDKTDMSLFEKNYHNDASDLRSAGASAYPPALLLKVMDLFNNPVGCLTSLLFTWNNNVAKNRKGVQGKYYNKSPRGRFGTRPRHNCFVHIDKQ
jgi:hypothetical protein